MPRITFDEAYAIISFIKNHEREDIPDDVWDICQNLCDVVDEDDDCEDDYYTGSF